MKRRAALLTMPSGGDTTAPTAPTGLTATPVSASQINLAWTDTSSDEAGFRVYRSTDGVNYSQIGTDLAAGTQAYNDTTPTGGTTYYYKVGVFDAAGNEAMTGAVSTNTLLLSLAGYWKLENVVDATGNNTDLTNDGGLSFSAAKILNGVANAGSANRLWHASTANLQTGNIDFTIACWAKFNALVANQGIAAKASSGQIEWAIQCNTTPRLVFWVSSNGTGFTNSVVANNFGAPSIDTFYFIVAWHDAAGDTINIQVNDGTANSGAYASGLIAGTGIFSIARVDVVGWNQNGMTDELGFWKRVLTAAERTSLFNGGTGKTYPF